MQAVAAIIFLAVQVHREVLWQMTCRHLLISMP